MRDRKFDERFDKIMDRSFSVMDKAQKNAKWIVLAWLVAVLSGIGGGIWLLLYILDTYVGKA